MNKRLLSFLLTLVFLFSACLPIISNNAYAAEINTRNNQKASCSIRFATPDKTDFFGGEIINLYNQVEISGNTAILEEGSYTLIYLPKDKISKPKNADINTVFDTFKDLSITETEEYYIIKTSYTSLAGGYNAATPFKISLIPHYTVNNQEAIIKQEFYNVNGDKLCENELAIKEKASIERPSNEFYNPVNIKSDVEDNYTVKPGTKYDFSYRSLNAPNYDYNDPRDRRVSVQIPEGLTLVNTDNSWIYDNAAKTWYKDIKRDKVNSSTLKAIVDLGGLDLNDYPSYSESKEIKLNYTLSIVENGVVQNDIPSSNWSCSRKFYASKQVQPPTEQGAYESISSMREQKLVDRAYTYSSLHTYNKVFLPYEESLLPDFRLNFYHQSIYSYNFYNLKTGDVPSLKIKTTKTEVTGYTYPSEIRLNLKTSGLTEDEKNNFTSKVQGTKAYGVKYDGTEVLICDSVPIGYDDEGDYFKFDGSQYKTVKFEYPNGGILLNNPAEINKYKNVLGTDVIADFRKEAVVDLKSKLENSKEPKLSYTENANGLGTYDDRSYTYYEIKYRKMEADPEATIHNNSTSVDTDTYKYLNFNEIKADSSIKIGNGSIFYLSDTLRTNLRYRHVRNGNSFLSINPENPNLYYLVPDGLEPIENPAVFSKMQIIRGYKEGYNLVIAKPVETKIPTGDGVISDVTNTYELEFKVSGRLDYKQYTIHAAYVIDNNKIEVINQEQYGIVQYDTPSGLWEGITNTMDNRSETADKFTNLGSVSFTVYPPLVLSAYKDVKLRTEPDSKYASALGNRATVGDEIDFRWYLKNNSTKTIDNIVIIDILPYNNDKNIVANQAGDYNPRGSKFKTPLQSVESHEKFDLYYSTDTVKNTIDENKNANWKTSVDDYSKVTMIKAVLKPGQKIDVKEICTIVTHNQIENNSNIQDKDKAFNSFAYSLNNGLTFTEALKTEVPVHYPKKDILVKKVDVRDRKITIPNAKFNLYSSDGRLLQEDLTTNRNGQLLLRNLFVGRSFYLVETFVPLPYEVDSKKINFTVSDSPDEQVVVVTNGTPKIDSPQTGDNENLILYGALIVAVLAIAGIVIYKKKKDNK